MAIEDKCSLLKKKCVPCEGGTKPMLEGEVMEAVAKFEGWQLIDKKTIKKRFKFKDFKSAIQFINNVADIAESENHHPDIYIYYNKVDINLSTHAIGGLSENDFILAAKIDAI